MRIAYLLSQYPSIPHAYLMREVRHLREQGWNIDVVSIRQCDRRPEELTEVERDEFQRTEYLFPLRVGRSLVAHAATLMSYPGGYFRGLRWAFKYGGWHPMRTAYALVYFTEALLAGRSLLAKGHPHFHLHYCSTVGTMVALVFPLSVSMTIHGSGEFINPDAFQVPDKIRVSRRVIAISSYGKSQLMLHSGPEEWPKLAVVPLAFDAESYAPVPVREAPDPFEILCVGRLCNGKGYELLIEAIAELAKQNRNAVLRLVGGGEEHDRLERLCETFGVRNRVIFEGWRNQDELRALYARADAFALASFAEGVPVVLMEAMATGLPCVATRITGIPELIRDGVDGLLVTPGDGADLLQALIRLMDNTDLRRRLGANARARVVEKHDPAAQTTKLAQVFEACLK